MNTHVSVFHPSAASSAPGTTAPRQEDGYWEIRRSYQEYYPLITASVIVGITPSALYYIVDKGRIPMYVVEGTRRIKHEDLVEYMEKVRSNAEGKDNISQMLPGPAYDRTANLPEMTEELRPLVEEVRRLLS